MEILSRIPSRLQFLGQYQHDDDDNFANFFIKSTDENCPVVVNLSFVLHQSTDAPCALSDEELLNCCCSYYFYKGKWYFLDIPADIANYRIGQSVWPPPMIDRNIRCLV